MLVIAQDETVSAAELGVLFKSSGIHRPHDDFQRLEKMLKHANLVVSARDNGALVGVARAFTDFSWICFVCDLAVAQSHQRQGCGKLLLAKLHEISGEQTSLCLNAGPGAESYYGHIGFQQIPSAWRIPRQR